ncbi:MAG TPA: carboxypeptidase-like regulatory domain-containing protein, partial [Gemmatimonadaceae bacterium]
LSPVLAGRYGLDVVDSVYAAFIDASHSSATITVRDDTLRVPAIKLPSRLDGLNRLCAHSGAGAPSSNIVVLLGTLTGPRGPFGGDVAVHSGFKPFSAQLESTARPDSTVARTSDDGQFVICGVPRAALVFLRAVRGGTVLGDTAFAAHAWPAQLVDWSATPGSPRRVTSGSFAGYVRVDTTSTPVVGASIEIASLGQSERSAGNGAFLMTDLPSGRYGVQVIGSGYTVVQDSVSIVVGKQARRVYEMQARTAPRDAAPPARDSSALPSPQLRAFEERSRARTGGYFVTEAELRSYESLPLVAALEKYIPGLLTVNYEGATLLASGRGTGTLQLLPHAIPGDSVSPRRCWVSLYSDGVRIFTADSTRAAPDFSNYSTSDYGGIEFYPGGGSLPPLFDVTAGNDCGVLALWKRER